jgi:DNA-binding beta-propeller fold protein YncE
MPRIPVFLIALVAAPPADAQSIALSPAGDYALNRPASIDYDPDYCAIWIANEGPEVTLVTLSGEELHRFGSDLRRIKALAATPDGLIVTDGYGGFQWLAKDGTPRGTPFDLGPAGFDTEGIAATADGTLILVSDDPARVRWVAPDGRILREIIGETMDPPLTEPQGVAVDPRTGDVLVVDDLEGTNSLFLFDVGGRLIDRADLIAYGLDPEGIAIRPATGTLFVVFDQGARVAGLDYTRTAQATPVPDPVADCAFSALQPPRPPV